MFLGDRSGTVSSNRGCCDAGMAPQEGRAVPTGPSQVQHLHCKQPKSIRMKQAEDDALCLQNVQQCILSAGFCVARKPLPGHAELCPDPCPCPDTLLIHGMYPIASKTQCSDMYTARNAALYSGQNDAPCCTNSLPEGRWYTALVLQRQLWHADHVIEFTLTSCIHLHARYAYALTCMLKPQSHCEYTIIGLRKALTSNRDSSLANHDRPRSAVEHATGALKRFCRLSKYHCNNVSVAGLQL